MFDLGGGTFDVSILTIDNGVFEARCLHARNEASITLRQATRSAALLVSCSTICMLALLHVMPA